MFWSETAIGSGRGAGTRARPGLRRGKFLEDLSMTGEGRVNGCGAIRWMHRPTHIKSGGECRVCQCLPLTPLLGKR